MKETLVFLGALASFVLPLFNLPLAIRIAKRKSADDISLLWAVGVWTSIVLMTPAALYSSDGVFKIFGIMNLIFFSTVFFFTMKYRLFGRKERGSD